MYSYYITTYYIEHGRLYSLWIYTYYIEYEFLF
jgi:hypothetical protein